eukprot:1194846-Prorocentrum_minimum.AAC.5
MQIRPNRNKSCRSLRHAPSPLRPSTPPPGSPPSHIPSHAPLAPLSPPPGRGETCVLQADDVLLLLLHLGQFHYGYRFDTRARAAAAASARASAGIDGIEAPVATPWDSTASPKAPHTSAPPPPAEAPLASAAAARAGSPLSDADTLSRESSEEGKGGEAAVEEAEAVDDEAKVETEEAEEEEVEEGMQEEEAEEEEEEEEAGGSGRAEGRKNPKTPKPKREGRAGLGSYSEQTPRKLGKGCGGEVGSASWNGADIEVEATKMFARAPKGVTHAPEGRGWIGSTPLVEAAGALGTPAAQRGATHGPPAREGRVNFSFYSSYAGRLHVTVTASAPLGRHSPGVGDIGVGPCDRADVRDVHNISTKSVTFAEQIVVSTPTGDFDFSTKQKSHCLMVKSKQGPLIAEPYAFYQVKKQNKKNKQSALVGMTSLLYNNEGTLSLGLDADI